jgi:hypothetical protein
MATDGLLVNKIPIEPIRDRKKIAQIKNLRSWRSCFRLIQAGIRIAALGGGEQTLLRFMEENIAVWPMDIRFFGGIRIVFDADGIAQLVEKFFRFRK